MDRSAAIHYGGESPTSVGHPALGLHVVAVGSRKGTSPATRGGIHAQQRPIEFLPSGGYCDGDPSSSTPFINIVIISTELPRGYPVSLSNCNCESARLGGIERCPATAG